MTVLKFEVMFSQNATTMVEMVEARMDLEMLRRNCGSIFRRQHLHRDDFHTCNITATASRWKLLLCPAALQHYRTLLLHGLLPPVVPRALYDAMNTFMDYIVRAFGTSTDWNHDNSYSSLTATSDSLLSFETPSNLSLNVSSLSTSNFRNVVHALHSRTDRWLLGVLVYQPSAESHSGSESQHTSEKFGQRL